MLSSPASRPGAAGRIGGALALAVVAALSAAGLAAERLAGPPVGALLVALVLGIAVRAAAAPPATWQGGLAFAARAPLRWGVALMGCKVSLDQIAALQAAGMAAVLLPLALTFAGSLALGRLLRVERRLALLIAMGTSVCGASAILATSTIAGARNEQVASSLTIITLLGSAGMILAPIAGAVLGLGIKVYGLWVGASLHEVAQVMGAGFSAGEAAGTWAVIAKMLRVLCLAPLLVFVSLLEARQAPQTRRFGAAAFLPPWYVIAFLVTLAVNSAGWLPPGLTAAIGAAIPVLLCASLAAIGLQTDLGRLMRVGWRAGALGIAAAAAIAGLSLLMLDLCVAPAG